MKQVEGTALLVTISEDLSNDPVLKVWALDKTEKKTGGPRCLSTLSIQNGRRQFPVRCTIRGDLGYADTPRCLRSSH
jgi:vacuolar protein sorting-associated protein 11